MNLYSIKEIFSLLYANFWQHLLRLSFLFYYIFYLCQVKFSWIMTNCDFRLFIFFVFGTWESSYTISIVPYYTTAKTAAKQLFYLFDRLPKIDSLSEAGKKFVCILVYSWWETKGNRTFRLCMIIKLEIEF